MITAALNPDQSVAVVVFNQEKEAKSFTLSVGETQKNMVIEAQALQTIIIQ